MSTLPYISVIMPTWNAATYLRAAIDSILQQTFADFELIIVDDASTDATKDILLACQLHDIRIKVISNVSHLGITPSLNYALKLAKGQFIARHDADDISLPSRFEEQLEFLAKTPHIAMVGCLPQFIDAKGEELYIAQGPLLPREIYHHLFEENCISHGSVMLRRVALEFIGCYREFFVTSQDLDLWLRLAERSLIANLNRPLYRQRQHSASITFTKKIRLSPIAVEFAKQRLKHGKDALGLKYQGHWSEATKLRGRYARKKGAYKLFISSRQKRKKGCYLASLKDIGIASMLYPSSQLIRTALRRDLGQYVSVIRKCI